MDIFEKKNKKNQKKKLKQKTLIMLYNMLEQTLDVCGWRASWIFYDGGPYYRNQPTDLQNKSMGLFLYEEKPTSWKS